MTHWVWLEVLVQSLEHWHNLAVAKSVGCCSKCISYCRVHSRVVTMVVSKVAHVRWPNDFREVLIKYDVLPLSNHHSVEKTTIACTGTDHVVDRDSLASLLEECLLVPVRVDTLEVGSNTIVFSEEDGVHCCQSDLRGTAPH